MNYAQFQPVWLTDVASVKSFLVNAGNTAEWDADHNAAIADRIIQASAEIVDLLGWLPIPYVATLLFDYSKDYMNRKANMLWLSDAPLLAVTTLTNGDTATIASTAYALQPNNEYPKKYIKLLSSGYTYFKPKTGGQWEQAISLLGTWGYVPHYANCWKLTTQTVADNPLSSTATTLTVASTSGFSQGHYLQIESETVLVTAVASATKLTIERGALGTTAASHIATTVIRRYTHVAAIQRACTEWSAYLWKTKDKAGNQIEVYDNGITLDQGLDKRIYNALMRHSQVQIVSAG